MPCADYIDGNNWHDSKIAFLSGLICSKLCDENTPAGHCILGDSAFPASARVTNGKTVRARKSNEKYQTAASAELAAIDIVLQKVYQSESKIR
eukprot:IDg1930t1